MNPRSHMSIREFSRLTGIKPPNLRFYDQIGLLNPELRGENGYRYYSRHQLSSAYLIGDLRELGMGLEQIKRFSGDRTPEKLLDLLAEQDARIEGEIRRLGELRGLMDLRARMTREALSYGEHALFLSQRPAQQLFACPVLPPDMSADDGCVLAYEYAGKHGINMEYPLGAVVAREDVERGSANPVLRYYFRVLGGGNFTRPKGLYAVAFGRCDVWESGELYGRLLGFVREQGLRLGGDVYEDCLLDELSVQEVSRYGVRLEVCVEA